jgi:hypothetical protein
LTSQTFLILNGEVEQVYKRPVQLIAGYRLVGDDQVVLKVDPACIQGPDDHKTTQALTGCESDFVAIRTLHHIGRSQNVPILVQQLDIDFIALKKGKSTRADGPAQISCVQVE